MDEYFSEEACVLPNRLGITDPEEARI